MNLFHLLFCVLYSIYLEIKHRLNNDPTND